MTQNLIEAQNQGLFLTEEIHPQEFKLVNLPLVQIPIIHPLRIYRAKIYRKSSGQWKRLCFGKIKFIKFSQAPSQFIQVLAHQFGTCIKRLHQLPNQGINYNLKPSEQYQFNWEYTMEKGEIVNIALQTEEQFLSFKQLWEQSRSHNSQIQENQWISLIDPMMYTQQGQTQSNVNPILKNGYILGNPDI